MKLFMTPEDIAAKETARLAGREKCSSCGQPIPDEEMECPNCGRKRKGSIPVAALAAEQSKIAKPIVAQFCTVLAWLAVIPGVFLLIAGVMDSGPTGGY